MVDDGWYTAENSGGDSSSGSGSVGHGVGYGGYGTVIDMVLGYGVGHGVGYGLWCWVTVLPMVLGMTYLSIASRQCFFPKASACTKVTHTHTKVGVGPRAS